MSEQKNTEAKPFYKKTWFFIVVGVLVLGGLSSAFSGEDDAAQESTDESSSSTQSDSSEQEPVSVELQMPEVIGLSGRDADSTLDELGFQDVDFVDLSEEDRNVLVTSNWQVCSSSPSAGESHSEDAEIVLLVVKNDEDCDSPNDSNVDSGSDNETAEPVSLRMAVRDETSNGVPEDFEVWIRGTGSWFFAQDTLEEDAGPFPVGEPTSFFVYPQGRDSTEIEVNVLVSDEVTSKSVRDMITITVFDDEIEVSGTSIPELEKRFSR